MKSELFVKINKKTFFAASRVNIISPTRVIGNKHFFLGLTGDFNYKEIDRANEYVHPDKHHLQKFMETLRDCYLHQHVTEATRYRENETPNLLDLILSNEEGTVQNLTYLPPLGESDHICLRFNVIQSQQEEATPPSCNIFKTNFDAVREELSRHKWSVELNSDFESDYETFFDLLDSLVKKHSPLRSNKKSNKNIYMTSDATRLKNKKLRLWKRYVVNRTKYDLDNYVRCKNNLRTLTRNLRKNFENDLARNAKNKPKLFWKYANSSLKTISQIPSLKKLDGSYAATDKGKADTLNDYFASVFTEEDLSDIPSAPHMHCNETIVDIYITPEMVRTKLEQLNPNKSPGHDNIHPFTLRELADIICVPMAMLFNKSLQDGAHKNWRKAIITSIYKKGARQEPGNYRPVSLTSVISKIMESLVRDTLVYHLMKNNLLADEQHGFVPERNCITQLLNAWKNGQKWWKKAMLSM